MKTMVRRGEGEAVKSVKVLVTGKVHASCLKILEEPPPELALGVPIELDLRPDCPRAELFEHVKTADVLLSRSETTVDQEVLSAGDQLSVVARAAVGYGNIDVDFATQKGVLVVNTPGKNTNSAAELTLGLLLDMARHITPAHGNMKKGGWNRHQFTGIELLGKKIGIVGLGNVGHRVAKFCNGFDMDVLAYDPYISTDVFRRHRVTQCQELGELLEQVDILTVHVPLNKETKGMISQKELVQLKPGAWVLNAARGGVLHEPDLLTALESGHVACAGIDTWEDEPTPLRGLVEHPKVIATPHIGASTQEAQIRIGETIAVQILKALRGEIVDFPVNLPNLTVLPDIASRNMAVLLEKLGRMLAQLHDFRPTSLTLRVPSELSPDLYELLSVSAIKGFLAHSSDEFVSYVNARLLFESRGLELNTVSKEGSERPAREILLELSGEEKQEQVRLGGALYDGKIPRITLINKHEFEMEPSGDLLLVSNEDRPGVVGNVGSFLSQESLNIAQFDLSRNTTGGEAMALIRTDGRLKKEAVARMEELPHVIRVRRIFGL